MEINAAQGHKLIYDANGLASDRDQRVGVTVTIPNRVTGSQNDYRTFNPYDPGSRLLGATPPMMPAPQAHGGGCHHGGCGGVGKIPVAVVVIVAVVYTAGALAEAGPRGRCGHRSWIWGPGDAAAGFATGRRKRSPFGRMVGTNAAGCV